MGDGRGKGRGTGVPITFGCVKCRSTIGARRVSHVEATGRTKPVYGKRGRNRPPRSTGTYYEYRCIVCGHVGWSRHVDVERSFQLGRWRVRMDVNFGGV
jgi:hypothetical protein